MTDADHTQLIRENVDLTYKVAHLERDLDYALQSLDKWLSEPGDDLDPGTLAYLRNRLRMLQEGLLSK